MKWFLIKRYPEVPKHAGDYEQVIVKVDDEMVTDFLNDCGNSKNVLCSGDSLGDLIQKFSSYVNRTN